MTDDDYENLRLLLEANPEELASLIASCSESDFNYFNSILEVAKIEIIELVQQKNNNFFEANSVIGMIKNGTK